MSEESLTCDSACASSMPQQPAPSNRGVTFNILGMDCADEIALLKREVGPLVGGEDNLSFDLLKGRMTVIGSQVSILAVSEAVARTGMQAQLLAGGSRRDAAEDDPRQRRQTVAMVLSGVLLAVGFMLQVGLGQVGGDQAHAFTHPVGTEMPLVALLAYLAAILLGGRYIVPKALLAARRWRPDMNLLMTLAVLGAMAIGEWLEAAVVTFLFALSLVLESWSVGRARRAIAALLDLTPPMARVKLPEGGERDLPIAEVPVGAHFVVQPGDRVPLDGRVLTGRSYVNQAPITGESLPVLKETNADVYAGTLNGEGTLEVENVKPAQDTTLAQIIRLVSEAQQRRSPTERWVDRFAALYTPAVMVLALGVLLVPLLGGGAWDTWLYRALVLLVIACPCALVISTPVTLVSALTRAARAGVLIKGGAPLEAAAHLRVIALDKTGTLTQGQPAVVAVVPLNGHSESELLTRAAALESRSTHPLAGAILEYALSLGVTAAPATAVHMLPGKGISGEVEGRPFWLGSHRYLQERGQETAEVKKYAEALAQAGHSVVAIGNDDHVCGFMAIADPLRPAAKSVINALHTLGQRLVMLTGDNQATAYHTAQQLGVDTVKAELLPADKVTAIEDLVKQHRVVAMVGDGVNDAPALACASLGIAMGAVGSDAAIETADVALLSDDLERLPWLVQHARRTLAVLRQNISFALAIKALFVVLTFVGFASLWAAIAADMGASLLVITNGLRLLKA